MARRTICSGRHTPGSLLLLHLHLVHVKQHQDLFQSGDELPTTYFPLNAVVLLVVVLSNGVTIEAAMVGRDGVVSAASERLTHNARGTRQNRPSEPRMSAPGPIEHRFGRAPRHRHAQVQTRYRDAV